jgi:hypothetical protein
VNRVSFAVQAHPLREQMAQKLAAEIGGAVDIVYDPAPDHGFGTWRCFRRLLEETPDWATHRFQIQDDTQVSRRFRETVELLVAARPESVLVLFVSNVPWHHQDAVLQACKNDQPWASLGPSYWLPVVSTIWPVELAQRALAFADENEWNGCADDELLGRFMSDQNLTAYATVPSLVEHPDDVPSLMGRRDRMNNVAREHNGYYGRVAACWIGNCSECGDPSLIDWALGTK